MLVFLIVLATVAVPLFQSGTQGRLGCPAQCGGDLAKLELPSISRSDYQGRRVQLRILLEFSTRVGWSYVGAADCSRGDDARLSKYQATCIAAAIAVMLLACLGPVVNVVCKRAFESLPEMLSDLVVDRTLMAPIIGLQCRCLPIVLLPLLLISHRWYRRHQSNIRTDGLNGWIRNALWFREPSTHPPHRMVVGFRDCLGELACYLLLLPAQVSTVAMRVFELLHYGVRYRESGLCLVSALMGMTAAILLENGSATTHSRRTLYRRAFSRDNRVDLAD